MNWEIGIDIYILLIQCINHAKSLFQWVNSLHDLYIVSVVYIYVNPNLPIHPAPPLLFFGVHTFVLYACVSISALNKIIYTTFFPPRFHIYALTHNICFAHSRLHLLSVSISYGWNPCPLWMIQMLAPATIQFSVVLTIVGSLGLSWHLFALGLQR